MTDQTDVFPDGFDPDERGIPGPEAAQILGVKEATLATWRSKGKGPRFRKIGRRVEYTPRFIKEFQQACVRAPEPAATRRQRRTLEAATSPDCRKPRVEILVSA